ncbi:GDNF family receptor alpha-2 [Bombina bombina]|uniref:GDNF family receptor alpha-2 n=1 Tax=Bombina bombina TaxID=8345 RepID=UPI00235A88F8|nr:GDNF family receptor alpha-2 [Bombina bombina]
MLIQHTPCCLLFLAHLALSVSDSPDSLLVSWPQHTDCIQANELCSADPICSSRYRTLRQCLAGRDRNALLSSPECQNVMEVLQESALYLCRCRRGMKRELHCLQVYWSIHAGLSDGEEFYEASPYEPVTFRFSDIFRLASISSGSEASPSKHNACLDAAKSCNLNDVCKRQRTGFISTCAAGAENCGRHKCHKALRNFMERVPMDLSYPMLFCPCRDTACAERRRQTTVPSCSFQRTTNPNCMEIWSACRQDPVCRSRLADFITNCQVSSQTVSGCARDNYPACLGAYAGLIGFDVALNFLDSDPHSLSIGPWCTCKGSGELETECETYLKEFTNNRCLKNAINAFGNGTDVVHVKSTPRTPLTTSLPKPERKDPLPDNQSDSNTVYESNPRICTSLQDIKNNSSPEFRICVSENQLSTNLNDDQRIYGDNSGVSHLRICGLYIIFCILSLSIYF